MDGLDVGQRRRDDARGAPTRRAVGRRTTEPARHAHRRNVGVERVDGTERRVRWWDEPRRRLPPGGLLGDDHAGWPCSRLRAGPHYSKAPLGTEERPLIPKKQRVHWKRRGVSLGRRAVSLVRTAVDVRQGAVSLVRAALLERETAPVTREAAFITRETAPDEIETASVTREAAVLRRETAVLTRDPPVLSVRDTVIPLPSARNPGLHGRSAEVRPWENPAKRLTHDASHLPPGAARQKRHNHHRHAVAFRYRAVRPGA